MAGDGGEMVLELMRERGGGRERGRGEREGGGRERYKIVGLFLDINDIFSA